MYTGLRIGEVQALQLGDIGTDRIYVRHNWARSDGLKSPKNGEAREVKICAELRHLLLRQGMTNPFGTEQSDFIFWGPSRTKPRGSRQWNDSLRDAQKKAHIPSDRFTTFHSWRHFFASCMADYVDERKLKLATGHKSLRMIEHYASHESEQTLRELGELSERLFSGIIKKIL